MRTFCRVALGLLAAGFLVAPALAVVYTPGVDNVSMPRVVLSDTMNPSYPPAALRAKAEGKIAMSVVVRADGSVAEAEVLKSTRPRLGFEDAALAAVKTWSFEPAMKDGVAVDSYAFVYLTFDAPPPGFKGDGMVTGGVMQPSGGSPTPGFGAGPEGPSASDATGNPPPVRIGNGKTFSNRTPNPPEYCGPDDTICIYDPRDIWRDVNQRDDGLYQPN
jgi:TonB family protein